MIDRPHYHNVHGQRRRLWAKFFVSAATPNPTSIVTKMPTGQKLWISWGDGTTTEVTGNDTELTTSHTYTPLVVGAMIQIRHSNNINLLKYFSIYNQKYTGQSPLFAKMPSVTRIWVRNNSLSGPVLSWTGCTVLSEIYYWSSGLSGQIPAFPPNTRQIYLNDNQFTGDIPSLTGLSNSNLAYFYNNQLTGFAGGMPLGARTYALDFNASNNQLTEAAVNLILASAIDVTFKAGDKINISGGTNAAPTGQGITDKATLISRGWVVTTN